MIRRLIPSLLILMTVVAAAKIAMPFLIDYSKQEQSEMTVVDSLLDEESAAMDAQEQGLTFEEDLLNMAVPLLPSVETAAAIVLIEEAYAAPADQELLTSLRKTQDKLAEKERALSEREALAKKAEEQAIERIAELEQLETRIKDLLQQEKSINDKKIKRLTAVYEGMKAQKAAPVIAQMKLNTVVKMFSRMNEKQVGKILSFLSAKKAVQISQALTQKIGKLKK
ncbi:MAG: hypothetical protein R8K22_04540 [Mariprofundaceae bacterium]